MNALLQRFSALDPRLARAIVAALCLVALFEVWVVLRAPMAELRSLTATRQRLAASSASDRSNAAELERLTRELEAVERRIAESGTGTGGDDARVPQLITALDAGAARHGVHLGAVRPPVLRPLPGFDEIGYGVDARGEYRGLYDWLRETARQAQPLVVAGLTLKAVDEGRSVALQLRLAAYRPSGEKP